MQTKRALLLGASALERVVRGLLLREGEHYAPRLWPVRQISQKTTALPSPIEHVETKSLTVTKLGCRISIATTAPPSTPAARIDQTLTRPKRLNATYTGTARTKIAAYE